MDLCNVETVCLAPVSHKFYHIVVHSLTGLQQSGFLSSTPLKPLTFTLPSSLSELLSSHCFCPQHLIQLSPPSPSRNFLHLTSGDPCFLLLCPTSKYQPGLHFPPSSSPTPPPIHGCCKYHLHRRSPTFLAPGPVSWKTIFPQTRVVGMVWG